MAKFPVEIQDQEGIVDAVNYLMSGPAGLGQNFAGFSSFAQAWLTGNFRVPYTQPTVANLFVAPIALSTSEQLDGRTFKYTFASTQPSAPFALGNGVTVQGVANDWFDGSYIAIGVVQCTTDFVIVRSSGSFDIEPPSTGGEIFLTTGIEFISTDANARVTVTGGQDRVFISGQLDNAISYNIASGPATLKYTVAVNRYVAFLNDDPTNPEFRFNLDKTVSQKVYNFSGLSGTGTVPLQDTVFATVLDEPDPDYYWYILEVSFEFTSGTGEVTDSELGLRSLSAQVVKQ
ncbi:hypothetical protein UFOVP849_36 [uncultured Caudovirales phage]|uniref:Uncharacterized protein n=1 Tax=uncultured Caudovirales phage TaxID=2100421 RepID=A0A6J5P5Z5_9CAUD|nr:hypothetical protein UFOVP849_36 [uncultured Caudovirales phage]